MKRHLYTLAAIALVAALGFAGLPVAQEIINPQTNASALTSGTVAAARGGAGTVNGALKGDGSGNVTQANCAALSNAATSCSTDTTNAANISSGTLPAGRYQTGPSSWTPADGSGASLTFTAVSANYVQIGNMVYAYAQLTYPSTASGSNATISGFPVAFPASTYGRQCTLTFTNAAATPPAFLVPSQGTSTAIFFGSTGAVTTNAVLSTVTVIFICVYPAA